MVELINQGWTTIREKGKVTRLKMPISKDSTKTVQSDPDQTMANEVEVEGRIPYSITIQLEPKNENAYCRVHRLAQTPFLNIEIQTLQSVRYLIEFLENKWKNRRNQFLEKFNISEPRSFINVENNSATAAATAAEQENENDCHQKSSDNSLSNSSIKYFAENLTLFPNEGMHKLKDIDLNEDMEDISKDNDNNIDEGARVKLKSTGVNEDQQEGNLGTASPPKQPNPQQPMKPLVNRTNMIEQTMLMNDETMMIDDFALIATKVNQKKCTDAEASETNAMADGNPSTMLLADQLRAGLNVSNLKIVPDTKDFKDLTFAELYLALDKPEKIGFKYDWISASRKPNRSYINTNLKSQIAAGSTNSISPSFGSFDFSKIQRQRFYIETLASVASSFLNSIQTAKQASSHSNNQEPGMNQAENKANSKSSKTDGNQKASNNTVGHLNAQSKSPQKAPAISVQAPVAASAVTSQLPSPNVEAIAAGAQPLDAALVRLNSQEHNSTTQKLLSDLNSKKRSRQRKQVMVVGNVGGNKHSPLPKLNLNMDFNQLSCQLNISPQSSNNSNNSTYETFAITQQNIVCSGKMKVCYLTLSDPSKLCRDSLEQKMAHRVTFCEDDKSWSTFNLKTYLGGCP